MQDPNEISYFAETDARNKRIPFGIKAKDRTRHVYVIGKTGMGKSTLLENMAVQDLKNGNGICFIDPHGKTADLLMEYVPEHRINDVLYFAPFDTDHPISFNVMEDVGYDKRHLVVSGLMSSFKKIWQDAWSARMEYILSNALLALLEYPDSTLLSVNKMLADKPFREKVVANITDVSVRSFWVDEFAKYTDRFAAEATPAIQNKIGQFTANPLIRNIIGQPNSSFDIRKMMDERKIIIINLSKGRIGELNAQLLGSMLVTKIYLAAMSRADMNEEELDKLPNFYLFVDEFQSFANESFADILSEARKYKLNLTIAHQYIEQMPEEVRYAVFGNVGTLITFRVGATDAEYLEKEFAPVFLAQDIVNLGFTQIYLRLMIDGIGSSPFSAKTLPPIAKDERHFVQEIIDASRRQYARPRAMVEEEIRELMQGDSSGDGGKQKGGQGGQQGQGGNGKNKGGDSRQNSGGQNSGSAHNGLQNNSAPKKNNTQSRDNASGRNNDSKRAPRDARDTQKAPKTQPAIDPAMRAELEAALAARKQKELEKPEQADVDVLDESLSLQKALQRKVSHGNDPKKVSGENRDSLRSALEAALGGAVSGEPKQSRQSEPPQQQKQEKQPPAKQQEVSADELRKVLDIES